MNARRLAPLIGAAAVAAGAAHAAPSRLVTSGVRTHLACPAGDAHVLGSGNRVTVDGRCASLEIAGSDNEVTVDLAPGGRATVTGDRNRIVFTGARAPEVVSNGAYNTVTPAIADPPSAGTPGAVVVLAAPAGPLLLDPASTERDVSCRDRDVVISGEGQRYVLRGGCRSVTVRGGLNTITAELLPGAAIAVGSAGVLLNYVLIGEGPAPVVRVTARGLRAKQIQHYGSSSLVLATE